MYAELINEKMSSTYDTWKDKERVEILKLYAAFGRNSLSTKCVLARFGFPPQSNMVPGEAGNVHSRAARTVELLYQREFEVNELFSLSIREISLNGINHLPF
jgi:hypothetical protein